MTSKSQTRDLITYIGAENTRGRLVTKRSVYAACIASFEPLFRALTFRALAETEASRAATRNQVEIALAAMYVATNNLRLIAPAPVNQAVHLAAEHLLTFRNDDQWRTEFQHLESETLQAMREDLGESRL